MITSANANARVRDSLVFPNGIKRLLNKPGSACTPPPCTAISHQAVPRRLSLRFERDLDLNQEFPRALRGYEGARVDVRFGSQADVTLLNLDVRFTPESGYSPTRSGCPLWAQKQTHALQQNRGDSMEQFCRGLTLRRGLAAVPHTQSPQAYPSLRSRERT
jgi:hypothetical protein